jgi:hypothetical protein
MLDRAAEITCCFVKELEEQLLGRKNLLFLYDTNWTLTLRSCLKALSNASPGTVMEISYGKETFKNHMRATYIYIMEINKNLLQSVKKMQSTGMGVVPVWIYDSSYSCNHISGLAYLSHITHLTV